MSSWPENRIQHHKNVSKSSMMVWQAIPFILRTYCVSELKQVASFWLQHVFQRPNLWNHSNFHAHITSNVATAKIIFGARQSFSYCTSSVTVCSVSCNAHLWCFRRCFILSAIVMKIWLWVLISMLQSARHGVQSYFLVKMTFRTGSSDKNFLRCEEFNNTRKITHNL